MRIFGARKKGSAKSNSAESLVLTMSGPPAQGEVQAMSRKMDELINPLRQPT
jgi:hypothetical protein